MAARVLIVEDDKTLAELIADSLRAHGYEASVAHDGDAALATVRSTQHDLVLLDVMLPGRDGFEICDVIRQRGRVPIIFVTARSQKPDRLRGLRLGADDYLIKPFDRDELIARIQAVLRRTQPTIDRLMLGELTVNFIDQKVSLKGRAIHLTDREFELLRYLAERNGRVVYRSELFREIWGFIDFHPTTRSVDHAITRLRKKIEPDPHNPRFIHTVHGDGYRLTVAGEPER